MAQIQPISTWYQGQERQANIFNLYGTGNNLINLGSATFMYQLIELIVISPEEQTSQTLVSGELSIHGAEYEQYCSETDPNAWIYQWAATKLNLVIIG
jgi:hypothetical protein